MLVFRDDINGHEAAEPFADDYRSPGKLSVTAGKLDTARCGRLRRRRLQRGRGLLRPQRRQGRGLHAAGRPHAAHVPGLQDQAVEGRPPKSIKAAAKDLKAGTDFNASVADGTLLVQLLGTVREDTPFVIPAAN